MLRYLATAAIVSFLPACAGVSTVEVGESAGRGDDQVAVVLLIADSALDGWSYHITAIDGEPVPREVPRARLAPGEHRLRYTCWAALEVSTTVQGAGEINHVFQAGATYRGRVVRERGYHTHSGSRSRDVAAGKCSLDTFTAGGRN
jgi:hypothetical protein